MAISPDEKNVLGVINHLEHKKTIPTLETIQTDDWVREGLDIPSLVKVLNQLIDCELVFRKGSIYSLTKKGFAQAKQFQSEGFSTIMIACEQSATNRKFCKLVYGLDLCQFNMMSKTQLDKLLEVMNLCKDDHILDLGCGVGLVSEYISDVTGANVLGIDFAAEAIKRAQERTYKKRDRLSYQVMDMDELRLPDKSFSGVISIDTLYFVNDLMRTIHSARECLQENGRMGIFYSTKISAGQTNDNLTPEQTQLAKILQESGLNYQNWDFTQDEVEIWEKVLQVSEELKNEFEAEGNLDIYESNVSETKSLLEYVRTGRTSRYLYLIQ
jgi:ubiquinone/menaquinone biosynthesis C-methylase UbiE